MRFVIFALGLCAAPALAESMCGVTDEALLYSVLAGEWEHRGRGAYITASSDEGGDIDGFTRFSESGEVAVDDLTHAVMPLLTLSLSDPVYNVDQLDDILETVEADWIADEVSDTVCGPEALPHLSADYQIDETLWGRLTAIPYFSDRVVMVLEAEWEGDWGLAFITTATLLTRP